MLTDWEGSSGLAGTTGGTTTGTVTTTGVSAVTATGTSVVTATSLGALGRGGAKNGLEVNEDLLLLGLGLEDLGLGGRDKGLLLLVLKGSSLPLGVINTLVSLTDGALGLSLSGLDLKLLKVLLKSKGVVDLLGDNLSGGIGSNLLLGDLLTGSLILSLLLVITPALVDLLLRVGLASLGVSVGTGVLGTLVLVVTGSGLGGLGAVGSTASVTVAEAASLPVAAGFLLERAPARGAGAASAFLEVVVFFTTSRTGPAEARGVSSSPGKTC